ncbi:hypothetical protein DAPPUDRAFT_244898 [Daphnia pulex]|uniref:Secreted protein n=1 Tax=Daphnia pulex TaxID=6669 RepID=E9GM35_DAPPU|nr:hypothetical protein DAPPUDRAFT_244898 [Daphnia pulex]|eukprot:EFX79459.1 hypothetical protein DAPPUDRAFT_244898 [Daphnia pulex]
MLRHFLLLLLLPSRLDFEAMTTLRATTTTKRRKKISVSSHTSPLPIADTSELSKKRIFSQGYRTGGGPRAGRDRSARGMMGPPISMMDGPVSETGWPLHAGRK